MKNKNDVEETSKEEERKNSLLFSLLRLFSHLVVVEPHKVRDRRLHRGPGPSRRSHGSSQLALVVASAARERPQSSGELLEAQLLGGGGGAARGAGLRESQVDVGGHELAVAAASFTACGGGFEEPGGADELGEAGPVELRGGAGRQRERRDRCPGSGGARRGGGGGGARGAAGSVGGVGEENGFQLLFFFFLGAGVGGGFGEGRGWGREKTWKAVVRVFFSPFCRFIFFSKNRNKGTKKTLFSSSERKRPPLNSFVRSLCYLELLLSLILLPRT